MPEKAMLPANFADAPISFYRRGLNFLVSAGCNRRGGFGAFAFGGCLRIPDLPGNWFRQLGFPDPDSEAAG